MESAEPAEFVSLDGFMNHTLEYLATHITHSMKVGQQYLNAMHMFRDEEIEKTPLWNRKNEGLLERDLEKTN